MLKVGLEDLKLNLNLTSVPTMLSVWWRRGLIVLLLCVRG